MEALVIVVADPARPEHAAAHAAARSLEPRLPAGARLLNVPALDVDLADDVAACASVLVVAVNDRATRVETRPVEAAPHGEFGRALEPGHLLEIAYATHGARPRMLLVAVPRGADAEAVTEEILHLLEA